jgi:RimJ/RimL family protein N-acetyltransferase
VAAPFRLPVSPPLLGDSVVSLRRAAPSDVSLLVAGSHDEDVVRWTFLPGGLDLASAAALQQRWDSMAVDGRARRYVVCAAAEPSQGFGIVTLTLQDAEDPECADVAYWLLPAGRGRGLMTHAVQLLVAWAFAEAHCSRLALHTKEGNIASEAVARRCGFHAVGSRTWTYQGQRIHLRRWERLPG